MTVRRCSAARPRTAPGAWSYTTAALSNGAHSLTATATDAAGNTGVASSALASPSTRVRRGSRRISSFSTDSGVVGDHITNDNTLTLAGTAEAGSTVKVYDGTTLLNSLTASGSGAWSYTTAAPSQWWPQPDRDRNRCRRQNRCSLIHDTGATAPGSIDLRTLGLTEDHTVRAVIGQIIEQHFDNLPDGNRHSFKNHGFDADTLQQIESATGFDIIAHNHGSKHIRPDTIVHPMATTAPLRKI